MQVDRHRQRDEHHRAEVREAGADQADQPLGEKNEERDRQGAQLQPGPTDLTATARAATVVAKANDHQTRTPDQRVAAAERGEQLDQVDVGVAVEEPGLEVEGRGGEVGGVVAAEHRSGEGEDGEEGQDEEAEQKDEPHAASVERREPGSETGGRSLEACRDSAQQQGGREEKHDAEKLAVGSRPGLERVPRRRPRDAAVARRRDRRAAGGPPPRRRSPGATLWTAIRLAP